LTRKRSRRKLLWKLQQKRAINLNFDEFSSLFVVMYYDQLFDMCVWIFYVSIVNEAVQAALINDHILVKLFSDLK